MGCVHLNEPKQSCLNGPLAGRTLLNPVASHSEVGIGVAGLPRIPCEADIPFDSRFLTDDGNAVMGCQ